MSTTTTTTSRYTTSNSIINTSTTAGSGSVGGIQGSGSFGAYSSGGGGGITSSSIFSSSTIISRPPVILNFVSLTIPHINCNNNNNNTNNHPANVIIEAGFAGQSKWKYIVEVLPHALKRTTIGTETTATTTTTSISNNDTSNSTSSIISIDTTTSEQYYRIYSNAIEYVFHILGNDSKDRRVIIVHNDGIYIKRSFQLAISRILHDIIGTRSVSYQSSISMIPFAFIPTTTISTSLSSSSSTSSTTSYNNTFLIVHITLQGAQCIIFSDKIVLEYTYQTCGYNNYNTTTRTTTTDPLSMLDVLKMQAQWLSSNENDSTTTTSNDPINSNNNNEQQFDPSNSLLITIIKTLEACPRQLRLQAINSIVFSGNIIDPMFGHKVAKQLQQQLSLPKSHSSDGQQQRRTRRTTTEPIDNDKDNESTNPDDVTLEEKNDSTTTTTTGTSSSINFKQYYSYIPYDAKSLSPLADYVAIVQMIPNHIRTDLLSWIGTSTWASHWHENYDPDSKQFQWINLLPSSSPLVSTTTTTTTTTTVP